MAASPRRKVWMTKTVNGYTYVDHLSWDAYNESTDLVIQIELCKKRLGMLPQELQADKLYLGTANWKYVKNCDGNCYPLAGQIGAFPPSLGRRNPPIQS